jgi:hypothetical protein
MAFGIWSFPLERHAFIPSRRIVPYLGSFSITLSHQDHRRLVALRPQLGRSHSKRERLTKIYSLIWHLQEERHDEPVSYGSIVERASFAPLNLTAEEVVVLIDQLKRETMIVEKKDKQYLVVKSETRSQS